MNNLFCITSHCNDEDKIEILKKNINILKNLGFKILVASHIPLCDKILSSIDYFIYDKSNPILYYPERYMDFWKTVEVDKKFLKLNTYLPDYGWTVLNQYKKIGAFCKELNYDQYTFINYDIQLTQEMLNKIKHPSGNIMSNVKWSRNDSNIVKFPSLLFFSFTSNDFFRFSSLLNKQDYIDGTHTDSESYVENLLHSFEYEIFEEMVEDEYDFKVVEDENIWNFNTDNNYFELFVTNENIIIYNFKKSIKFNINGEEGVLTKNKKLDNNIKSIGYYDEDNILVSILHLLDNKKFHTTIRDDE
tara:strand:+ start:895 stop:1803 length:909 start_codon:yes stop_codon:yes gene_type:complete